jgi:hypothetical protein
MEHWWNNDWQEKPEVLGEKPAQHHKDCPGMTEHKGNVFRFIMKYFSFILYFRDKHFNML